MIIYLISFWYCTKNLSRELWYNQNTFFGSNIYIFITCIMNIFLIGIFAMIMDAINYLKIQFTIIFVQYTLWKIKRKYKIK